MDLNAANVAVFIRVVTFSILYITMKTCTTKYSTVLINKNTYACRHTILPRNNLAKNASETQVFCVCCASTGARGCVCYGSVLHLCGVHTASAGTRSCAYCAGNMRSRASGRSEKQSSSKIFGKYRCPVFG